MKQSLFKDDYGTIRNRLVLTKVQPELYRLTLLSFDREGFYRAGCTMITEFDNISDALHRYDVCSVGFLTC